ncbi:hypothetical protein [Flavobacterium geliluteum]|uniref:Uncharacterized protein n=1 Tax=Flavobacterium geliluteum TaxID=2816120 RepID=A0A941B452_9FLAO|nr:hypothetical protein [Flavobacterium geliluteum]MBP4139213.1 hypothetical protein [Flavobacterium geliluteum]
MNLDELLDYLALIEKDNRLNVWHFALLSAILYLGYRQGQKKAINVSRSKIMALAHIHTLPTYHKYFKELQIFGYIHYTPSYHPGYKSKVQLLI